MIAIFVDVPITRRKKFHLVCDGPPWVEPLFRHRDFGAIVDWLRSEGHSRYMLHTDDGEYEVSCVRVGSTEKG